MNNLYNVYINRNHSKICRGLRNARTLAKSVNLAEIYKITACSENPKYPRTIYSSKLICTFLNPDLGKIFGYTDEAVLTK